MTSLDPSSVPSTLGATGEDALIRRIAQWMARDSGSASGAELPPWVGMDLVAGIGDDAAIVRPSPGAPPMALTTDMLVEGTHFLPDHPPEALGTKALASNLSDLAAVGAWPAWYLVSFGAPSDLGIEWAESLCAGMQAVAAPYGCLCIGGDCVRSDAVTISITAGGTCAPDVEVPLRSRAEPGQSVYATGALGDSGAGLSLLREPERVEQILARKHCPGLLRPPAQEDIDYLIARHQRPTARVEAGMAIARHCPDAAMMDLSDGLATDLPRLAEASQCGIKVRLAALPISPPLKRLAEHLPETPRDCALFGGEDYELLFTTAEPESRWRDQVARAAKGEPLRIKRIGKVVSGAAHVSFLDSRGRVMELTGKGFRHFSG